MTDPASSPDPDDDFVRIESDRDPRARRLRNLGFVGIPTLVACGLVIALGVPWWIVAAFLVLFGLFVVANS